MVAAGIPDTIVIGRGSGYATATMLSHLVATILLIVFIF